MGVSEGWKIDGRKGWAEELYFENDLTSNPHSFRSTRFIPRSSGPPESRPNEKTPIPVRYGNTH